MIDLFPSPSRADAIERENNLRAIHQKLGARIISTHADKSCESDKNEMSDLEKREAELAYRRAQYQIKKYGNTRKRAAARAMRQEVILKAMREKPLSIPLTVAQIVYRFEVGEIAIVDADMRDLHTRGLVTREWIRNSSRKFVWGYKICDEQDKT